MPAELLLPTLAAGLDWLEVLIPLAVFVLWVLAQVVGFLVRLAGGGEQAAAPPRPPAARPPALPRPIATPRSAEREALERQVEEFLGRAPRGGAPVRRTPRMPPSRKPAAAPPAPPRAAARPTGGGEFDTGDVARHVREVFDHGVGQLAPAAVVRDERPAGATPAAAVADVLTLLRSPTGIRQILLARELLERPVGRW